MEKKNKRLVLLLLLVLAANLIFVFVPKKGLNISFDDQIFMIADTAAVSNVKLSREGQNIEMSRTEEGWELNGLYPVDEGFRQLLFSIMQRVRVKKPVSLSTEPLGTLVQFGESSFLVSGNATKTKTFFTKGETSYEVEIPGYRDYLAGIFELKADQWRDREVYNGSWRTIQKLELDYTGSDDTDFEISFDQEFFKVAEVNPIDSSMVVDYLNQFQNWKTNEWISEGRFPKYDSLSKTVPTAKLTIESITYSAPETFSLFPALGNEPYSLVQNSTGDLMIFDQKRIKNILIQRDDFKLNE